MCLTCRSWLPLLAALATCLCLGCRATDPCMPAAAGVPGKPLPQFIMPTVELEIESGKLAEAVRELERLCREADPAHHGVRMTLERQPHKLKTQTAGGIVRATQAPFGEVLRLFCLVTDCGYRMAGDQVVIGPALDRANLWSTNSEAVAAQQRKMETVVVPKVEICGCPCGHTTRFISKRAAERDPDGLGVPISVRNAGFAIFPQRAARHKADAWPYVTVDMDVSNVSVADLMDFLVLVSGGSHAPEPGYLVTGYGIVWGVGATAVPSHPPNTKAARAVEAKLKSITVPQIDFDEVTLQRFWFIRKRSQELDPDNEGINIIFNVPDTAWARTSTARLRLDNVPLATAFDAVCKATGTRWYIMANAVIITGPP